MTHRTTTPRYVRLSPGTGELPYSEITSRVSVVAAAHLLSFIWEECSASPCATVGTIRKKFEDAGHIYRTWPFERLLDDLARAGLVEICARGKGQE